MGGGSPSPQENRRGHWDCAQRVRPRPASGNGADNLGGYLILQVDFNRAIEADRSKDVPLEVQVPSS